MRHIPTKEATPLYRVVDAFVSNLLGYPFDDWLLDQRDGGYSWDAIAARLKERTDGVVDVSYRTIQRWATEADRKVS